MFLNLSTARCPHRKINQETLLKIWQLKLITQTNLNNNKIKFQLLKTRNKQSKVQRHKKN